MPVRISIGNDLLAGPKDIDVGIDDSAEISQISLRRRSELAGESRIVRIVRGTNDKALGVAPGANIGDHSSLKVWQSIDVAAHIVEQDAEHVHTDFVDLQYLRAQRHLSLRVVIQVNLKRRQSDSQRDTDVPTPRVEFR